MELRNLLNIVMSSFCHRSWRVVMTRFIVSTIEAEFVYNLFVDLKSYFSLSISLCGDDIRVEERISTYFGLVIFFSNHRAHLSVLFSVLFSFFLILSLVICVKLLYVILCPI